MRCSQVQNLIPELMEGALAGSKRDAVAEHLRGCASCKSAETAYERAFGALRQTASPSESLDLWSAFSARLGAELTCDAARELIPQQDWALPGLAADSLASHLRACAACAAEAACMARSLAALESVPSAVRAPDLWPAFSARTAGRPARAGGFALVIRSLYPWLKGPLPSPHLRPALLAGVAVVAVLLLQVRGWAPGAPPAGAPSVEIARIPDVEQPEKLAPAPTPDPAATADRTTVPITAVPARRSGFQRRSFRARRQATPRRQETHPVAPRAPAPPVAPQPRELLAGNTTPTLPSDAMLVSEGEPESPRVTTVTGMPAAGGKVMPEVLQAVALLAGLDDAANNPFGGGR